MVNLSEIKKQIQGEVLIDEATLEKFSRDASIFEVKPEAVIFPKDVEDIKNLVKWVAAKKAVQPGLSITARSAGTDMGGGAVNDSLILDFTPHFNKILEIKTLSLSSVTLPP